MADKQQRPAAMREARDIEWLVNWALEKQGLGNTLRGEASGRSRDIPTGMRVDGGGGGFDGKWTHDDAIVIADVIGAMSRDKRTAESAGLVVHYGQVGTRPEWGKEGSGRYELVRRNNGTGAAVKRYRDQRKGAHIIGFEWEWVGNDPAELDMLMLQWMAWHAALSDLRVAVNSRLTKYVATGPAVPECPSDMPAVVIHMTA